MASEDLSRVTELVVSPVTLSHFTLLVYLTSISDHLSASPPLHDILHTIVSLKLCFHLVWLIQSSSQSLWVWTVKTTKCLVAAPLKCITLLWLYCFIDLDLCVFLLSVYTLGNGENTNVHLQKVVFFFSSLLSSYFLFFLPNNMIDGFKLYRGKDWQSYHYRLKVKGCCCSRERCARKQDVSLGSFTQRHLGAHAVMSLVSVQTRGQ